MQSRIRSIEQERALRAWETIEEINRHPSDSHKKKYNSLVKRFPVLVLTNGLGQALAYLKAKGNNSLTGSNFLGGVYGTLYRQISTWVCPRLGQDRGDLLSCIMEGDSALLRRATSEALAFLQWLKRFAEAELPAGGDDDLG